MLSNEYYTEICEVALKSIKMDCVFNYVAFVVLCKFRVDEIFFPRLETEFWSLKNENCGIVIKQEVIYSTFKGLGYA